MSKFCDCCGRGPATGNAVSHSNRHTRRRWLINVQSVRVDVGGGETRKLHICTKCLRLPVKFRGPFKNGPFFIVITLSLMVFRIFKQLLSSVFIDKNFSRS